MEENLFEWYEDRLLKFNFNPQEVVDHGKYVDTTYYGSDHIIFSGFSFYKKYTHSKDFKCNANTKLRNIHYRDLTDEQIRDYMHVDGRLDNQLSAMSELISEKKYRAYKFMTAKHFVIEEDNRYYLLSPDFLLSKIQKFTYQDVMWSDKNKPLTDITRVARKTYQFKLAEIIQNKELYLSFMTEHCYEQFVKFVINGIFDFSNDDSFDNIVLVKHKKDNRFKDIFVCDKESTAFNFMVAQGFGYKKIKRILDEYSEYGGVVINNFGKDGITFRIDEMKRLFDRGIMGSTHLQILKQIAETDYDKLAEEALSNTSLKKNQTQIDLYKYGSELAGNLAHQIEK